MERPEIISKLSFYLMDKEPLLYLFIINSDFIFDKDGILAQPGKDGTIHEGFAGVMYSNNRVKFYYTNSFLNLPLNQLYFILIHEAQHVFKNHIGDLHKNLNEKNPLLTNIAEDAIINSEILDMKFLGIQPESPENLILIPTEYTNEYYSLGKDANTTPRLFDWYLKRKKDNKKDLLKQVKTCKNTENGKYGYVSYDSSTKEEEKLNVLYFPTKEDMMNFANGKNDMNYDQATDTSVDNLIPVAIAGKHGDYQSGLEKDIEFEGYFDKKIGDNEEIIKEENIIPQRVFVENLFKKSEQMIENNPSLQAARKTAGITEGNSLSGSVSSLLKSQVNWKKEFKQGLNVFMSDRGSIKGYKQSYITHLMNPRSRYGMIGKHRLKTTTKVQNYIIIAIDTSGSCFYDDFDKQRFFTEIDEIAKEMSFNNTGKIYTLMWDSYVTDENMYEYKVGDWKKYKLRGGGGTNPQSIFRHLTRRSEVIGNGMIMKLNDKESIMVENKKKLPMLLVLTDGYFYTSFNEDDLRIYKQDKKSVMFLTRKVSSIPKGLKSIVYK